MKKIIFFLTFFCFAYAQVNSNNPDPEKLKLSLLDRQSIVEILLLMNEKIAGLTEKINQLQQENKELNKRVQELEKQLLKNFAEYNFTAESLYSSATFFQQPKPPANGCCEMPALPGKAKEKLFEVPLLVPSKANVKAITDDNDIILGIADGIHFLGIERMDKQNYSDVVFYFCSAADSSKLEGEAVQAYKPKELSLPNTIEKLQITLDIGPEGSVLQGKLETPLLGPMAHKFNNKLDPNRLWKLVAFQEDSPEVYGFVSVEVKIYNN